MPGKRILAVWLCFVLFWGMISEVAAPAFAQGAEVGSEPTASPEAGTTVLLPDILPDPSVPETGSAPDPTPEPAHELTPELTPDPTPELTPEPTPEPTSEPMPGLTAEPAAETTAEPEPEPSTALPDDKLNTNGYACFLQNDSPVYKKAGTGNQVLAVLSKDDVVYISERIDNGQTENDWLLCHFCTAEGMYAGYIRARSVRFASGDETAALIEKIRSSGSDAYFEGHPLMMLDCEIVLEPAEPSPEPTEEPVAETAGDATPEPELDAEIEPTVAPFPEPVVLEGFAELGELAQIKAPAGTAAKDVAFPAVIRGFSSGEAIDIAVSWRLADETAVWEDGNTYAFLPLLPAEYIPAEGVSLPQILVTVSEPDSAAILIDPLVASPGDTVKLTAIVTGYEGASFQWQWAAIPQKKVTEALETIDETAAAEDLREVSENLAVSGAEAGELTWVDEPEATDLVFCFTATKENLNRYWRLVITFPQTQEDPSTGARHASLLELCLQFLFAGALAEKSEVVVTCGYPSLLNAAALDFTYTIANNKVKITGYTGSETDLVVPDLIEGLPVTEIGNNAFKQAGLLGITLPASLESIDDKAFAGCPNVAGYDIAPSNMAFSSLKGVLYNKAKTTLVAYPKGKSGADFSIPVTVETIGNQAFADCLQLTSILIFGDLKRIGDYAFSGCSGIELITLPGYPRRPGFFTFPETLVDIGDYAFYDCRGNITLPKNVQHIGEGAFKNCVYTPEVIMPGGINIITDSLFENCYNLNSMVIPDGVTSIGANAFLCCYNLVSIKIPSSVTSIGANAFYNCSSLTVYGYTGSYAQTFALENDLPFEDILSPASEFTYSVYNDTAGITGYTGNATEIIIPETIGGRTVVSVGLGRAFSQNYTITSITLPKTVKELLSDAFRDFHALRTVNGLENVETVWGYAFSGCGLSEVAFSTKLRKIDMSAFFATNIMKITIPDDVELGDRAFSENFKLHTITLLPSGRTPKYQLIDGVLYSADGKTLVLYPAGSVRTSYTIPDGVTTIEKYAFSFRQFISSLRQLFIPRSITQIKAEYAELVEYRNCMMFVYDQSYAHQVFQAYPDVQIVLIDEDNPAAVIQSKIDQIFQEVITPGMSDYQKAVALHDWVVLNTEYDYSLTYRDAYSVFFRGTAVCQGYEDAYSALLTQAGIENMQTAYMSINHGFNLVKLEGNWYYIDCTFDDTGESGVRHDYFGMTDLMLEQMYDIVPVGGPKTAMSIDCNYDYRSGRYDAVIASCTSAIGSRIQQGERDFVLPYPGFSFVPGNMYVAYNVVALALSKKSWTTAGGDEWQANVRYHKGENGYRVFVYKKGPDTPEDFLFELEGGKASITKYIGSQSTVIVPPSILGYPVTHIANGAFQEMSAITAITLPEGLVSIGEYAFASCTLLKDINLPDSLTTLGQGAFENCNSLEEVVIPERVTVIPGFAFSCCANLRKVTLKGPVTRFEDAAAFQNCMNLVEINIPESVVYIGHGTFSSCSKLKFYGLPSHLEALGPFALADIASITSLHIPATLTQMGENVLGGSNFRYLENITVDPGNPLFKVIDGMLLTRDGARLLFYASGLDDVSCVVPDGVAIIDDYAFASAKYLKEVVLPDTVTKLGNIGYGEVFGQCSALETIIIPPLVKSIDDASFHNCTSLRSIQLPEGLEKLGKMAFAGCTALQYIDIPDSVSMIDEYAFIHSGIKELRLPSMLSLVSPSLFYQCFNLESVIVPDGVEELGSSSFGDCTALKGIELPDSVAVIGDNAFSNTAIKEFRVPLGVGAVKGSLFSGAGIDELEAHPFVTEIDPAIFEEGSSPIIYGYKGTYAEKFSSDNGYTFVELELHLVTGVNFTKTSETMVVGAKLQLTANVSPSDATYKKVTWSSSNPAVATVTAKGIVDAVQPGTAVITATAADGSGVMATCAVTVTKLVTGITLSKPTLTLSIGGSATLAATVLPANATNKKVAWSSSNMAIASVDQSGKVTGVKAGTATVTATATDGSGIKATCAVTVAQPVTGIALNLSKITIGVGQAVSTVTASVSPSNATNKGVVWASKAPSVAKVDSKGKITGVKAGTAVITATAADGSKKAASVTVTVVAKGKGVTAIKLSKASATISEKATLMLKATLTPSTAANKTVAWSSNNTAVAKVSSTGVVTGVKKGTATITVISSSGVSAKCTIKVEEVPVSSVKLSKTALTMLAGSIYQLTATVLPADAKVKTLTWSSSNTAIATVSASGKVTAKAPGKATITAKSNNGKTASCMVTVNPVKITKLTLSPSSATILIAKGEALGKQITIKANITPANATIRTLNWTTSNSKVATVDQDGVVKSVGLGTATITAAAKDGSGKKATCTITVAALKVTSLKVTGLATMVVGSTQKLSLTVLPANAQNSSVSWTSSNSNIATVDAQGNIVAKAKGTVTITVTAKDGSGKKATFGITVR